MRTAIGATAVNIAKPANLSVPMIYAFLDNIRYITIELNGLTLYDTRDDGTPFVLCRGAHRHRHPRTPLTLFLSWAQTSGVLLAGPVVVARTHHRSRLLAGARTYSSMSAGVISRGSCDRWSKKCRSRSASAIGTSN